MKDIITKINEYIDTNLTAKDCENILLALNEYKENNNPNELKSTYYKVWSIGVQFDRSKFDRNNDFGHGDIFKV